MSQLATKAELLEVKTELQAMELRLEAKMEGLKADLLKWMVGAIGFQTVVIVGAIVSLIKVLTR